MKLLNRGVVHSPSGGMMELSNGVVESSSGGMVDLSNRQMVEW